MASRPTHLLTPLSLSTTLHLRNRIVMTSLTRNRCTDANKPTPAVAEHYAARAKDGAGLIIAEGIFVYLNGCDWLHTPVLYSMEHAEAWRVVTERVHEVGGKIFCQVWHPGRSQNENMPMLKNANYPVYAASDVPSKSGRYRLLDGNPGHTQTPTPITDPGEIISQYENTARLAKHAGFDGIEVLAQGDYLLHNFLLSRSNPLSPTPQTRTTFLLTLLTTLTTIYPASHIGLKIAPSDTMGDTASPYAETHATYTYLLREVVARGLGYVCLCRRGAWGSELEERVQDGELPAGYDVLAEYGRLVKSEGSRTKLMVNFEVGVEEGERLVREGKVDFVGWGRGFVYNPDFVGRVKKGRPLAENDRGEHVYYGGAEGDLEGYNDWAFDDGE